MFDASSNIHICNIHFLKGIPTVKQLLDIASVIRDQVNEHVFVFAWAATIVQRKDTRFLRVPPIWEVFPDKFVGTCTLYKEQI